MIVTIIAAIVLTCLLIAAWTDRWDTVWEKMVISFIIMLSVVIAWTALSWALGFSLPKTNTYSNQEIVSVKDSSSTSGSFFLGSGYIDGKMVYTFYQKQDDGFKLEQAEAENTIVYESENAYIIRETGCNGDWQWINPCVYDSSVIKEIHVPNGTIKQNFVLDAE